MKQFEYKITFESGVHARPAGLLVNMVKNYDAVVKMSNGEETNEVRTIVSIMGLGLMKGDTVIVSAEGKDESVAIAEIKTFFEQNL
jgi:phosphocarrier protein